MKKKRKKTKKIKSLKKRNKLTILLRKNQQKNQMYIKLVKTLMLVHKQDMVKSIEMNKKIMIKKSCQIIKKKMKDINKILKYKIKVQQKEKINLINC